LEQKAQQKALRPSIQAEGSAKGAGAKQKALRRGLGDPAPAGFAAPAGAGWRRAPDTGRGEELEGRSEEGRGERGGEKGVSPIIAAMAALDLSAASLC
ncbi:unnamed protein product, partial [Prorocentrum cordatum]